MSLLILITDELVPIGLTLVDNKSDILVSIQVYSLLYCNTCIQSDILVSIQVYTLIYWYQYRYTLWYTGINTGLQSDIPVSYRYTLWKTDINTGIQSVILVSIQVYSLIYWYQYRYTVCYTGINTCIHSDILISIQLF